MAAVKDAVCRAGEMIGKIPDRYSMTALDMDKIREACRGDLFHSMNMAFGFGFYQGIKAEKARSKQHG